MNVEYGAAPDFNIHHSLFNIRYSNRWPEAMGYASLGGAERLR
jgi:hypothetical protein